MFEEQSVKGSFYQKILCLYIELLILLKKEDETFHYLRKAQKIAQRKNSSIIEKARIWLQLSKISLDKGSINQSIFLIDEYVLPVAESEYAFSIIVKAYLTKTEALLYNYKLRNDEKSLLESKRTMEKLIDLTYNKGLFLEYIRAQFLNSVLISTTPEGKEEGRNILQNAIKLANKYGIMNLEYLGRNIAEELASRDELSNFEMVNVFERNLKAISYRMFLTDESQKLLNLSSMVLIAQDKTGPNIFSKENTDGYTLEILLKLATFTVIAIGQGDSYNKGLFGPMPVPNKKDYLTLLFSFTIEDKKLQDQRYEGKNYALIAFMVHNKVIHFFYNRKAIKEVFEVSISKVTNIKNIDNEFLASLRNKLLTSCVPKWKTFE